MSESWLSPYDTGAKDWTASQFKSLMFETWDKLKPYYSKVHGYVRMKLRNLPQFEGKIKKYGSIPIHLVGNMWGQVRQIFQHVVCM